jgi:hypothetical protein
VWRGGSAVNIAKLPDLLRPNTR